MDKSKLIISYKKLQSSLKGVPELSEHLGAIKAFLVSLPDKKQILTDIPGLPEEVTNADVVALFSDGACRGNPGPGSWGFVCQVEEGKYEFENAGVDKHTTNNRMEMTGVIEALKYGRDNHSGKSFIMFTDSKYVVDGINSWVEGWKKRGWKKADKKEPENIGLWKKIDELNQSLNITFKWVKGHAGHTQNERCDQLANIALDEAGY